MILIDDVAVRRHLSFDLAMAAIEGAFRRFAHGEATVQRRVRTSAGPVKLSTMGSIDLGDGVAGAKVYTTIGGRFRFVVLLFSAETGAPLAVLAADGMTEIRTAATSAVAADALSLKDARRLAVFGTGVQARSHAKALARVRPVEEIRVVSRGDAGAFCRDLAETTGATVRQADTATALDGATLVVTATRATAPLFTLDMLTQGSFIAAVGSTLPGNAEIGHDVVGRARVVVEWRDQIGEEAGDLVRAAEAGRFDWDDAVELGRVLVGAAPGRLSPDDIVLFKSVGIGLEDVACAAAVWRRHMEEIA